MKGSFQDLTGKQFGRLTVRLRLANNKHNQVQWECLCDPEYGGCGKVIPVPATHLRSGNTSSCGCSKHGLRDTPEYDIWAGIKSRCYNRRVRGYSRYGGRGITMCDEWKNDFEAFYRDMGPRPSPEHSIERNDNDKEYSKDNCKWATDVEQANNRSSNAFYFHNGVGKTLATWCRELNLNYSTVSTRLHRGWSFEKAIQIYF